MKHVKLSSAWYFGSHPFGAYRCEMSYGRNQNDREFIGVNGVIPDEQGVLPENAFKVLKTKEGTILITAGEDLTNRCLLFVGSTGGFRGGVSVFDEGTTGKLLANVSASNACESGIEVVALLAVGESLAFHTSGRRTNQVEVYTWDGSEVVSKVWAKQEWDRRNDPAPTQDNITWIPGNFRIFSLSGDSVSEGICLEGGKLTRYDGNGQGLLAHGFAVPAEGEIDLISVRFGRDIHDELVIAPAIGEVDTARCAVLVHEYSPGCGAKRWPSFYIDWENAGQVEKLGSVYRGKGSGCDTYTLILAPMGWAENIASQFINERDYQSQTIAYKPGASRSDQTSDLPRDLFLAFNGDEDRVRQFMEKVKNLPADRLDEHAICVCGRARREAHLIEVSGDSDFFLGSDPNKVAQYIIGVYFSQENDNSSQHHDNTGNGNSLAEAFKKAGLA